MNENKLIFYFIATWIFIVAGFMLCYIAFDELIKYHKQENKVEIIEPDYEPYTWLVDSTAIPPHFIILRDSAEVYNNSDYYKHGEYLWVKIRGVK